MFVLHNFCDLLSFYFERIYSLALAYLLNFLFIKGKRQLLGIYFSWCMVIQNPYTIRQKLTEPDIVISHFIKEL